MIHQIGLLTDQVINYPLFLHTLSSRQAEIIIYLIGERCDLLVYRDDLALDIWR